MKSTKRLLTLLLTAVMLASAFAVMLTAPVSVTAEDNIQSDDPVTVDAYAEGMAAYILGGDYAIHMSLGAPFNAVRICMVTMTQKDSQVTVGLYKWQDDYNTTVEAEPVATTRINPIVDCGYNEFTFDEQPAGDYLIRLYGCSGIVGIMKGPMKASNSYCYVGGLESQADWWMQVDFTKTPIIPFLPTQSQEAAIDGNHKPPEQWQPAEDHILNTHQVMPDTWVFTDGLGRVSLTNAEVGDPKEDKTLAMFYWDWHTSGDTPVNLTEHMEKYPEAKHNYYHSSWPVTGTPVYYWNEPIYGYYRTDDPWVLRRQAELLANAGVDTVFMDNTNGFFTWKEGYDPLYKTWDAAQSLGAVNVPKVSFLLPFGPTEANYQQISDIYRDIYRKDRYPNLWFYWEKRPMLMAFGDQFLARTNNLEKEIAGFFTFRSGQASYVVESTPAKSWGWLSTYPQAIYSKRGSAGVKRGDIEQMTVGVAVNHDYVTGTLTAMNGENVIGRSYTTDYPDRFIKEGTEASKWGYQFAQQFEYALEVSPPVIFVTGWNEWVAGRGTDWNGVKNAFADQFTDEFSRDLEPSKGALQDHYYYQLVNFVRQYKGARPIPTPSLSATIDLAAGMSQWESVGPYYAAYIGNTDHRDADGKGIHYTETSGRNDIIGAKVARDDAYVYFLVECNANITPYTDSLWMNLYIDSDQSKQGWNTFEYVVNKSAASESTLVLEKFTADNDYAKTEKVADVEYKVDGKYMTVKIAKSDLGLSGNDYTVNFAWTDNVHDEGDYGKFSGDIMDFYISGDVAPGGRFKFSYVSTEENATGKPAETEPTETDTAEEPTDVPTDEPTDAPTDAPTEAPTDPATEPSTSTEPPEKGCGSALGVSAAALFTAMAAALVLAKSKEN